MSYIFSIPGSEMITIPLGGGIADYVKKNDTFETWRKKTNWLIQDSGRDIALGADTSGNFISTIAGTADQVIVTGSGSENSNVTLFLPQSIGKNSDVVFGNINGTVVTGSRLVATSTITTPSITVSGTGSFAVLSVSGSSNVTGKGTFGSVETPNLRVTSSADFTGADVTAKSFTGTTVTGITVNGSNITGITSVTSPSISATTNLFSPLANINTLSSDTSNIANLKVSTTADFTGVDVRAKSFTGTTVTGTTITGTNITGSTSVTSPSISASTSLSSPAANLTTVTSDTSNIAKLRVTSSADFTGVDVTAKSFTGTTVTGTNITGTTITGTNITGSTSVTSPSISATTSLSSPIGNLTTVNSTNGNLTTVNSTTGNIANLKVSTTADFTGVDVTAKSFTGTTVTGSTSITSPSISATTSLSSPVGNLTTVNSTTGNIANLKVSTTADFTGVDVTAKSFTGTTVTGTTVNGTTVTGTNITGSTSVTSPVGNLTTVNSTTGNLTTVNSTTGNITNIYSTSSTIGSGTFSTSLTSNGTLLVLGNSEVRGDLSVTNGKKLVIPSGITNIRNNEYTWPSSANVSNTYLRYDNNGQLSWSEINVLSSSIVFEDVVPVGVIVRWDKVNSLPTTKWAYCTGQAISSLTAITQTDRTALTNIYGSFLPTTSNVIIKIASDYVKRFSVILAEGITGTKNGGTVNLFDATSDSADALTQVTLKVNYDANTLALSGNQLKVKDGTFLSLASGGTVLGQVKVNGGSDITLANTSGNLIVGNNASTHIAIDGDDIQARNNNAASTLNLNRLGGVVTVTAAPTDGSHVVNKTYADKFLPLAGGSVTGLISCSIVPTADNHLVNKTYADKFLPLAGGSVTGLISCSIVPTANNHLVNKTYADKFLPLAGGAVSNVISCSTSPTDGNHLVNRAYADTKLALTGGTIDSDGTISCSTSPTDGNHLVNKTYADKFLPLAGGSVTGLISCSTSPTANNHLVNKTYADKFLPLAGGSVTGLISCSTAPTADNHLVNKTYADKFLPLAGGTISTNGLISCSTAPTANEHLVNKTYADKFLPLVGGSVSNVISCSTSPTADNHLVNKTYADKFLPLAGGSVSNVISCSTSPTADNHLVNRTYADTKLALTGGTVSNVISCSTSPSADNHLVNKTYADTKLAKTGGTVIGDISVTKTTDPLPTGGNISASGTIYGGSCVIGPTTAYGKLHIHESNTTSNETAEMRISVANLTDPVKNPTGAVGFIDFHAKAGVGQYNSIVAEGDQGIIFSNLAVLNGGTGGFYIAPWQGAVSGLRIDKDGNVGIGISSPSTKLEVSGVVKATSFNSTSSLRYKQNVQPLSNALNIIEKLQGVKFDWKETGKSDIGLIAEQVNEVVPEFVLKDEEGLPNAIDYGKLTSILIEAVKELSALVKSQKS